DRIPLETERGYNTTLPPGAFDLRTPPSSVSGLYFAHPQLHYFGVGRIEKDQVEDYARRKGWDLKKAERWLSPILNYEP
ncbi:MAG: hypothetical protein B7Z13_08290, partial [Caulobacterales bacterium 32-67-6]